MVNTKYNSPNTRFLVIIMSNWTLFSNHGHVLVCLARDSEARLRDVAADVGITERAVQKIVRDLQDGGMVSITKHGRRNRYRIHKKQPLRHNLEVNCTLRDLIGVVNKDSKPRSVEPKTVEQEPETVEQEPENTESEKPKLSDTIERQQGSLF